MSAPELTRLDKAALITVGAGVAGKVLLWGLGVSLDAPPWWAPYVIALFAILSFVAFDLVLASVVIDSRTHGMRWPGVLAVAGAAVVSASIGLQIASVVDWPALHAAPAVTLLLYALHLMWPYPQVAAARAGEAVAPAVPTATAAASVQVGVSIAPQLPATVAGFILAHAATDPQVTPPMLAVRLGTSADTVRRALAQQTDAVTLAMPVTTEQREEA